MKLTRKKRFHFEVATGSLSDIMFFLLLFFLIVSTLANPNVIKLFLPSAHHNQIVAKQQVTVSVSKTPDEVKHYFIDQGEVPLEQLKDVLKAKTDPMPRDSTGLVGPTVIIRLPYDLQVQDLVDVMQICVELKLKTVLATQKKES